MPIGWRQSKKKQVNKPKRANERLSGSALVNLRRFYYEKE